MPEWAPLKNAGRVAMNILQKLRWVKWKIRFGNRFNVPMKGTFLGTIQVHISGAQTLKLGSGFSCRDNISFNLSGGGLILAITHS